MKRWTAMLFLCSYFVLIAVSSGTARASPVTKHDRNVIRFFHNHPQLAATPAGALAIMKVLPHVIRALASARIEWPPHHALWLCIHSHEAMNWQDQDSGGNGHYGGLQMHLGWGYGTSYNPADDSQYAQEWAAERGYRANGYSQAWLMGQWDHPSCLGYA